MLGRGLAPKETDISPVNISLYHISTFPWLLVKLQFLAPSSVPENWHNQNQCSEILGESLTIYTKCKLKKENI